MKLIKAILQGYKRLALNNIHYIEITPESKIQLILGTNGSGKSSLVKELSPLPALHQEFTKDGFKIIEYTHNNSHYLLKSLFTNSGNSFHFIKDGEELNKGLTQTVYRELVRKEFGITIDIHELLIGENKFHSMSVAERRHWFTRISDSDYTYAIQYYMRLKEQYRDIQGTIKLQQSRLVQESEKLLQPDEEEKYRYEIKLFSQLLSNLLELKTPGTLSKVELNSKISQTELRLSTLSQALLKHKTSFPNHESFLSLEAIDSCLVETQALVHSKQRHIDELYAKIAKHQSTLNALKDTNISSFSDIDKSIETLLQDIQIKKKEIHLPLVFNEPNEALTALMDVYDYLTDIVTRIEVNDYQESRIYTRELYQVNLDRKTNLNQIKAKHTSLLNDCIVIKRELEHFRDHNELECPECNHKWIKGYDEVKYQTNLKLIDAITADIEASTKELEKIDIYLEKANHYFDLFRSYTHIQKACSILTPLWNYITLNEIIFKAPATITRIVETLKIDLQIAVQLQGMEVKLKEMFELKATLANNQEASIVSVQSAIDELNNKLYLENQSLQLCKQQVIKLNLYKSSTKAIESINDEILSILHERDIATDKFIELSKRDTLNKGIELTRMELSTRETIISRIDIQRAVVANIQLQLLELTDKAEVLKIAVKELSPTEGLIAKGLTGFINHFVHQINTFIRKIWLYPLELIPIAPDEDVDLDYKFAVKVNDDHIVPDISKGSSGMKEIIDLAFRVCSMPYLKLNTAPIYLDEFSVHLDSSHRQAAHYAIGNLINSSDYSQIFMISHYENSYGSLKNTDVTVLCPSNIGIPKDMVYNKHVIMH